MYLCGLLKHSNFIKITYASEAKLLSMCSLSVNFNQLNTSELNLCTYVV
jgi:hypothetical protein